MNGIRVVLAGGPKTGKTSSVAAIKEAVAAAGLPFYLYTEAASAFIRSGVTPDTVGQYEFQRLVLLKELENEADAERRLRGAPGVALFDRGSPDAWVYLSEDEGDRLAREYGVTRRELLARFDLCLFFRMDPREDGADITANNSARLESSAGELRSLARRAEKVWLAHPNCVCLDWENDPDIKPRKAAGAVLGQLTRVNGL